MTGPAAAYAEITKAVDGLIARHSGNDREQAAYMVARAAVLHVRADKGDQAASELAFRLGDEIATLGGGS